MLIDCHAHLLSKEFDADRAEVRRRAKERGVAAVLVVGEDLEEDRRLVSPAGTEPPPEDQAALLPCLGLHPDRFAEDRPEPSSAEIEETFSLIRSGAGRIAAIGEVGLDRYWVKTEERRRAQAALLERIAALAIELDLPLNVHSRAAGHYTIDLLRAAGVRRVLMHAFDGKAGHAARAAEEMGWIFSIPPSVVRSEQKQKLVRALPLEKLALESDSPVLGPERDQRNEPANVVVARDTIANLLGVGAEEVEEATTRAARSLFPLLGSI